MTFAFSIIDIVCAAIILTVAIIGAVKGFFKAFVQFLSYAVAAILAKTLSGFLSPMIYESFLQTKITDRLNALLPAGSVSGGISEAVEIAAKSLPEGVYKIADSLHIFSAITNGLNKNQVLTVAEIESRFASPILTKVLTIITSILLFIILAIILRLLANAIDKLIFKKGGTLTTLNRIGGFFLGALKGAVPVIFVVLLLLILSPVIEKDFLTAQVGDSFFCKWISNIFLR